jgi:hypothetical protein
MAFVRTHFEELLTGQGRAELATLQGSMLRELLASDELHVQSEQQVLEVRARS